ncbi:unnamed protein product [Haemonchus placei]|uniref:NHL repeat protein n=1 Tax=Haemonchus placei TaxID=6290 RepID=A0A0N4VVP4_HAEPC|nr:unnamed protein product [Haemonchus placei]
MVLMGRHAVPPSLSLHDFYHPLRADRLTPPSPSHSIETARHKRQTSETLLEWPTSLSVHLLTGQIFVLDSNIVYQLDRAQDAAEIVVGALTTCQNASSRHIVRNARDIAAATDGSLYIIESDGKKMNQVRRLSADRTSFPVIAGRKTACACDVVACGCDDAASPTSVISVKMALFSSPSAVSVDALGRVYVADAVNAKVKRITPRTAQYDSIARQYSVVDVDRNELYTFNRYGLHTSTQSLITGAVLYNFTYNVDTRSVEYTTIVTTCYYVNKVGVIPR